MRTDREMAKKAEAQLFVREYRGAWGQGIMNTQNAKGVAELNQEAERQLSTEETDTLKAQGQLITKYAQGVGPLSELELVELILSCEVIF